MEMQHTTQHLLLTADLLFEQFILCFYNCCRLYVDLPDVATPESVLVQVPQQAFPKESAGEG